MNVMRGGVPIGADRDPRDVLISQTFKEVAAFLAGVRFRADLQASSRCGSMSLGSSLTVLAKTKSRVSRQNGAMRPASVVKKPTIRPCAAQTSGRLNHPLLTSNRTALLKHEHHRVSVRLGV
jgi:hypothetical protein